MVNKQPQTEAMQRQALETFYGDRHFDFEIWAVAVKRQMLAALKKRESNRVNWE